MGRRAKPLTDAPAELSADERRELLRWLVGEIEARRLPHEFGTVKRRRLLLDECLDWHRSNGVQRHDWPSTVRNWFRKAAQIDAGNAPWQRERRRYEQPQETREMGEPPQHLGDVLRVIQGGKP